jgi:cyclic beta-1,2-glucan synthetase
VETLLGFTKRGDRLSFDPRIPPDWESFEIEYRYGSALYRCRIENPHRVEHGVAEVWLDGERVQDGAVVLRDDGHEHAVRIVMAVEPGRAMKR